VELDNTAELVFFKSTQVTKLPESISQAENAGSIPVTRSGELWWRFLVPLVFCLEPLDLEAFGSWRSTRALDTGYADPRWVDRSISAVRASFQQRCCRPWRSPGMFASMILAAIDPVEV
jgi:hypothetical protein